MYLLKMYHNTKRKDDPIRVIERKQARSESRRSDEERNEKENGATQCSRGRWGGGPFVGHTLGPPWRLIACNALLTCLASSYRQRRVARKTRVVQQQNPDDRGDAVLCPERSDPHDVDDEDDEDGDALQYVDPLVPLQPGTGSRPFRSVLVADPWNVTGTSWPLKWRRVLHHA